MSSTAPPTPAGPGPATDDVVVSRAAGSGAATWAMGSLFERLAGASETGGQLGVSVVTQPPGAASPLHVHTREAEAWYLLEGSMTYCAGEQFVSMTAGDFIYLPRGVPHAFRTGGPGPARFVALTVPGSLMDLYDELGRPATERRVPTGDVPAQDIARWMELSAAYGIQVVGPPIPAVEP
ncbi:cupin domain-containing protein [Actinomycetospora endophytica]|uniref:Cupin domain-containing protein n=1 Tax=Actinomycetospora endophytica TaxID=2291215 RepID=A0ABS8P9X3_9PSEU|nr:cupin domain-containing protein [Actinomycetospora endophytica]MCD2194722.1 cupin domain-containing protein [Actinomycetospora endophytica]